MRRVLLFLIRFFDRTAFRCAVCGKISHGLAPRIQGGWACSSNCYTLAQFVEHRGFLR